MKQGVIGEEGGFGGQWGGKFGNVASHAEGQTDVWCDGRSAVRLVAWPTAMQATNLAAVFNRSQSDLIINRYVSLGIDYLLKEMTRNLFCCLASPSAALVAYIAD